MTLDELFNVLREHENEPQDQEKQSKEDVKQDFENLQNALVALLTEVFSGSEDDTEDDGVSQEQDQSEDEFDKILKNNIDVLARLKTCDNNTYANCTCNRDTNQNKTVSEPTQSVLEPSKYSHWILKYLWDTKGVIHKTDYEFLRKFCDFVMAQ